MCDSSTWEVGAEGSGVQGHPGIFIKFEASLGYGRPGLFKTTKQQIVDKG